jgi:membrane protease YdiL (CAAX protease family)
MRETAVFFLYLLGCLVLGALLTYPVMGTGWIDHDPHRVMGRLTQVFILLGLWPFLKAMGLADLALLGYGATRRDFLHALWGGWLMGVSILLALALALFWLQVIVPDPGGEDWLGRLARKVLQGLLAGLLIGLLEETFFRGALYGTIRRRGGGVPSAVFWTALLYALLHFMKPHALPDGMVFDWAGAWHMFLHVFTGVFQWMHLDSMAALFLVGVFLALVRERTGHIGWCVGLHAGWVFVIQVTRHLTDGDPASPHAWLTGDYDGIIGWLAAAWIGLLALAYGPFVQRRVRRA